jgi:serine/threonine protein kinase
MNGHPNIPKLHGSFINEAGGFIVLERFSYNLFNASKSKLTQGQLNYSSIMRDVACALTFIKSKGHMHRDCKLGNILLPKDFKHAVLADFGEAREPAEEMSGKAGTARYRAIEMRDGKYGWEVDVLAFGKALEDLRQRLTNSQIKDNADWLECCAEACTRKDRYERPLIEGVLAALKVIAADPSGMKEADVRALLWTDAKANKVAHEKAREQRIAVKQQGVQELKAAAAKLKAATTKAAAASSALSSSSSAAAAVAPARGICHTHLKTGPNKGEECGRQRPCRYHH